MTPPISMGIQSPLVISCPCIALPRGMVVVRREDIRSMLDYRENEEFVEARVRLRVALEKKP